MAFLVLEHRLVWIAPYEKVQPPETYWRGYVGYTTLFVATLVAASQLPIIGVSGVATIAILFYAWIIVSWTWATKKRLSALRIVHWLIVGTVAFFIASLQSIYETVLMVVICSTGYIFVGLMICAWKKQLLNYKGRFAGGSLPNTIAHHCMVVILGTLYLERAGGISAYLLWPVLLLTLSLLALSRSRGSILTFLIASLVWLNPDTTLMSVSSWIWLWGAVFIVSILLPFNDGNSSNEPSVRSPISSDTAGDMPDLSSPTVMSAYRKLRNQGDKVTKMAAMGRPTEDATKLQGRLDLWRYIVPFILRRPILGAGFGSFWDKDRSRAAASWQPSSAHSLYLEALLNVGMVGLVLLLALFAAAGIASMQLPAPESQILISFLIMIGIRGLLESGVLTASYESFVIFALIFCLR